MHWVAYFIFTEMLVVPDLLWGMPVVPIFESRNSWRQMWYWVMMMDYSPLRRKISCPVPSKAECVCKRSVAHPGASEGVQWLDCQAQASLKIYSCKRCQATAQRMSNDPDALAFHLLDSIQHKRSQFLVGTSKPSMYPAVLAPRCATLWPRPGPRTKICLPILEVHGTAKGENTVVASHLSNETLHSPLRTLGQISDSCRNFNSVAHLPTRPVLNGGLLAEGNASVLSVQDGLGLIVT
mmetsp:Transcript_110636/g.195948  ORF Transcript_110636/g.195948 Transcript_110636/m.195948 type:complete len:238 (-) Transcript_110636:107-820(-)